MLKGMKLFEKVFADVISTQGYMEWYDIEDVDGVTCYNERLAWYDGWYIVNEISFRYKGTKYKFEKRDHSSVCDTEVDMSTFEEVVENNDPITKALNTVINGIEEEMYHSWEQIVDALEDIKRLVDTQDV